MSASSLKRASLDISELRKRGLLIEGPDRETPWDSMSHFVCFSRGLWVP